MKKPHRFDLCIIGAGSAGLTVAAAAAQLGARVALIERGEMGGECLNVGCVPSKALIAAARHAHAMRSGAPFGIAPVEPAVDFQKVHDHIHEVIAAIAPIDSQERFEKLGVRVLRTEARFTDARTVEAGGETIRARRFVVATGSRPAVPPIPGLDKVAYLTNETLFDLTALPDHLVVIGGGPIGLEMAQAFRRLGSAVTVLEALKPLAKDDPELSSFVLDALRREGVAILSGAKVEEIAPGESGAGVSVRASLGEGGARTIEGSHLLIATGRKPQVEEMGLDAAGITCSGKGITVDAGLRTSNRRVYAIGDAIGGLQFTHLGNYHAGLVVRSALFRLPVKVDNDIVPWVTYTDPELAHVGLTEAEARARHDRVTVLRWHFSDNDRAQTERATQGLVKVTVGKGGRILGADIVGEGAGELIAPWALAITQKLKIKAFTDTILPYPTLGEVNKRAAIGYYSGLADSPWIRRAVRLLALFG